MRDSAAVTATEGSAESTAYYPPKPTLPSDLALMRRVDELHLEHPFAGSRMLRDLLRLEGQPVGRKHVRTLMKKMGVEALYRKPNLSKRHDAHLIYPYLLRDLAINRPNQVWATDITYIPMRRGFVYLVAVIDWYSRRVLAWRLSNTLTTDFCLEAVSEAMARFGKPEIFNTDQGSQFTSSDFTDLLKNNGIKISMDGKGCWRDNVFIERLWKSVKYEEVYLKPTTLSPPPGTASAPIWRSTIPVGRINRLTEKRQIRSTSATVTVDDATPQGATYRCGNSV